MFQLDSNQIEDSYGVIQDTSNTKVVEAVDSLASVLMPEQGTNSLVDELLEHCKAVQAAYNNEFLPSTKGLLQDFRETFDISVYLEKRASVGEVAKKSVGYKSEGISCDSVIM